MPRLKSLRWSFKVLVLVSLTLAVFSVLRAERLPIKIYTSADGLGSSATFSLVRDSRGFIWLCSRDGLVRFDGYRFITYRIGKDDADPAVFNVLPTRNGVYWINLNRGTDYRFVDKGDATELQPIQQQLANDPRIPLLNLEPATSGFPQFEDQAGNLWTSSARGINLLHEVDGRLVSELVELNLPGLPADGLTSVTFVNRRAGGFWIGTNWGLVRRLPDGRMSHYRIDPKNNLDLVRYFAEDKNGCVWIARPDGLLVLKVEPAGELSGSNLPSQKVVVKPGRVDANGRAELPVQPGVAFTFTFQDMFRDNLAKHPAPENSKPVVWGVLCASDGKIWITNTGGLVVYDGRGFRHFTTEQGLATNNLSEIVEGNDGNIWLSSYSGLMRLNPNGLTVFDRRDGLAETRVHSIYEDRSGKLNVVTDNWNISQLRDGVFKTARPRVPDDARFFWHSNVAFLDSHGDWWVISNKAVYRYSGVDRIEELSSRQPVAVYTGENGLITNETSNIFEDSRGDIWIINDPTSKRVGLARWQRATNQFQHFFAADGLPANSYGSAFAEDRAGNLWFGFGDSGLARYENGHFTPLELKDGIPPGAITNLYIDSKGRLWIASSIGGLSRVDDPTAAHPVFRHYTIADGLTSNNIRCITEDLFGNIYVGTVRGVNRLSPDTGHLKYYGTGDGLAGDFVSAAHRDHNGTLWFGTFSGLSKITPEPDVPAPAPPTLISGLRIAGVDYSISPLGQTEVQAPEQSANSNNLQIDFFSVSPGGNTGTRYQYKLEGADQNWSLPTIQRTVTFANVRPGRYRFLVRAVNADDVAGDKPATLTFRILPPVWQRWWFIAVAVLLVAGAVFGLDRYRVARARELSAALAVSQELTEELTQKGDELSQANRTLALDYEVTRILAESATPGEAAPEILKAICQATDWDVGALWYVDDDSNVLRCAEVWHRPEIAAAEFESLSRASLFVPGEGLPGRVWQSGEPNWINELAKDTNFPRLGVAAKNQLQSAFAFPILLGSEVIGVGEFFSRQMRERDDEMLEMLAAIGSDIGQLIERKQKEEALRESEDRFRTLAETASDAIITIDASGLVVFVNPAVEKVFGYEPSELVGQDLTMLMPEYLRHLHRAGLQRYQETGQKHISWQAVELPGLHRSGREIPLELSFGEFVRNERRYFTGIVRDMTERKQAAEALQRSREERFRELERVRQRIATDLHDDIGSSLTQISIMSEVAQNRAGGDNVPALSTIANSSRELIDAMSDIVWAINPQKDHLSDLNQRMRRFAADVLTARNVELDFRAPLQDKDLELGANIRREIFLIFKETVNNMVKHSGLTRAEIDFQMADGNLVLRVSDNGQGFDTQSESDGHGLMSMRERTAALGGQMEITSTPGQGTTIILRAPLGKHENGRPQND
jgi:PAS domain S-box-containing protein